MSNSYLKNANDFIESDNQDLRFIFMKIKMLEELNRNISAYLDPSITKYCKVANLVNGTLTLIAANGSVSTQLRYQTTELIRQFSQHPSLKHINRIECKVHPSASQIIAPRLNTQPSSNMPLISQETAEIVSEIAESIEDKKLREIMQRIASRVKK